MYTKFHSNLTSRRWLIDKIEFSIPLQFEFFYPKKCPKQIKFISEIEKSNKYGTFTTMQVIFLA